MFVDASALVALLFLEPEAPHLAARLQAAGGGTTSPVAQFEAVAALMRRPISRREAEAELDELFGEIGIVVIDITPEIGHLALEAFDRYGKGRGHRAQLNMGDCFAYACARHLRVPLLYKGDDFTHTDIG